MTAINPQQPLAPLRSRCTSCLCPDGVLYQHDNGASEYLCKKCAQQMALWESATRQLEAMIFPVLATWHEVWGDVKGLTVGPEALRHLAERLDTIQHEEARADQESAEGQPRQP